MHVWKRCFWIRDWWAKVKVFWTWSVPNLGELGFKVGPSFIRYKLWLSTPIQANGFVRLNFFVFFIIVENGQRKPKKEEEGPTLKPSSPRLGTCEGQIWFYPCPPIIISKHAFSNVCGLPLRPPWLLFIFIHKAYFHLPRFIWKVHESPMVSF